MSGGVPSPGDGVPSPGDGVPSPGDGVPEAVVEEIRRHTRAEPVSAVVLGSGLGRVLEVARGASGDGDGIELGYGDLPGFPPPSVAGHAGRLWIGELTGRSVAVFQGRIHLYEGHPMRLCSLPARVAALLGARSIVLTAATGGVDRSLTAGSLVVLGDHVNLMGRNPLEGWRFPDGSPAFVDLSRVYDPTLAEAALAAVRRAGSNAAGGSSQTGVTGVYAALPGPSFETPAETELLRRAGATVVGMSMVPEAVVAHALGLRVLGLSFVTNQAGVPVSHDEILEASSEAAEVIGRVLVDLMEHV